MRRGNRSRTLRASVAAALAGGLAAAAALLGGGPGGAAPAPAAAAAAPPPAVRSHIPPVRRLVRVPYVLGMDHQQAQDTMQAAGLYRLFEEDATGQGRYLLWDRNWTVVAQRPAAGTRVPRRHAIVLYSVKDEELGLPPSPSG